LIDATLTKSSSQLILSISYTCERTHKIRSIWARSLSRAFFDREKHEDWEKGRDSRGLRGLK